MSNNSWVRVAAFGVALVVLPLLVSVLVMVDKDHFGSLVGRYFLPAIALGVIIGSIITLVAALRLPQRKTWRCIILIVWALIALTSPLFGWLFLVPWGVLAVMLPVVIVALVGLWKETRAPIAAGALSGAHPRSDLLGSRSDLLE